MGDEPLLVPNKIPLPWAAWKGWDGECRAKPVRCRGCSLLRGILLGLVWFLQLR